MNYKGADEDDGEIYLSFNFAVTPEMHGVIRDQITVSFFNRRFDLQT